MPAPPGRDLQIGALDVRLYPLCVLLGVLVWMLVTARLWQRGGGDPIAAIWVCIMAAPAALVGARLYSWFTDAARGAPSRALDFANGGLGLYGAVAAGALAIYVGVNARRWPVGIFLDCCVPGLAFGQAIGRWGNYFNQELFGGPTSLPWGLHVDEAYRPAAYLDDTIFQPTFLYESLWDLLTALALLYLLRRLPEHFGGGAVAASYLAIYGAGRLVIDGLRIDPAYMIFGMRFNQFASLAAMATTPLVLTMLYRRKNPPR